MRIWSLHPRYLDRQALVACWRETLLAQAVLAGDTKGYTQHPQLERFRACEEPIAAVGAYLRGLAAEADVRGYRFDRARIRHAGGHDVLIDVTRGQIEREREHLLAKLVVRTPEAFERFRSLRDPDPHPLFRVVPGPAAFWERARPAER
ncbi:pyrimidine dimer DNA glycosylase/endonuclease V [Microbacterium tumbae]